jgi:hypothetical protein
MGVFRDKKIKFGDFISIKYIFNSFFKKEKRQNFVP